MTPIPPDPDTLPCHLALLVISGTGQGHRVLVDRPAVLGRDPQSRVPVADDLVSRHHAVVEWLDGQLIVRDLGSKNGTYVNGREIREPTVLKSEDHLRIGRTQIAVVEVAPQESARADRAPADVETQEGSAAGAPKGGDHLRVNRLILRRASELTARLAALSRIRHSISAFSSTIRRSLQADAVGIYSAPPGLDAIFVEGPINLGEEDRAVLTAMERGSAWKADFLKRPVPSTTLFFPIHAEGRAAAVVVLGRENARPFEPLDLEFAETLSECLRALPLGQMLAQGSAQLLPDHLGIVGSSEPMNVLRTQIRSFAGTNVTVLIRGESGTGKELCARAVHQLSPRRFGPYIEVNCACMVSQLTEAELFGHEKGAFTGAVERRIGKVELADGGTLLLDEIGELDPDLQAKLLRVIEGQPFFRVGGNDSVRADVRFLCATNRNLEQMVEEGTFRRDLYHRINVLNLSVPPLRDRIEDIPELVPYLIRQIREDNAVAREYAVTPRAYRRLLSHLWPGNVRELRNVLERIMLLCSGHIIDEPMVPREVGSDEESTTVKLPRLQMLTEMIEREEISRALVESGGQKSQASRQLGISRPTLDKKIKMYGLDRLTASHRRQSSGETLADMDGKGDEGEEF